MHQQPATRRAAEQRASASHPRLERTDLALTPFSSSGMRRSRAPEQCEPDPKRPAAQRDSGSLLCTSTFTWS
jgi:hypothetical protein